MFANNMNRVLFPVHSSIVKALGIEKSQFPIEITSFDGKPFLMPSQLALLPLPEAQALKSQTTLNCDNVPLKPKAELMESPSKPESEKFNVTKKKIKQRGSSSVKSSELKGLECIQKKVKVEETISNSSTQGEEGAQSVQNLPANQQAAEGKPLKEYKQIVMVSFDQQRQQLIYTVRCQSNDKKTTEIIMTRDEILEEDANLLLYFYENHIEFTKTPNFTPKMLKGL